jgi:hypothetical protein
LPVAFVIDFPGATQQHYDAVLGELGVGLGAAPEQGELFHAAGSYESGWRVIDVWESREALDAFFRDRLAGALERAGMPSPLPPQVLEIYNLER